MLKKRILILSGGNCRGVLKLTYLENNYLDADFKAHFLPCGRYGLVVNIGGSCEFFAFDSEAAGRKLTGAFDFDAQIDAAVFEGDGEAPLMSASTGRTPDVCALRRCFKEHSAPSVSEPRAANTAPKPSAQAKPEETDGKQGAAPAEAAESPKKNLSKNSSKDTLGSSPKSAPESSFFDGVKDSIEEFFQKYPPHEELGRIVPSSKWVKVDTEDVYYVVGLLYNGAGVTHICYGIPGTYNVKPPSEILTEWLPLNPDKWEEDGFWMIYQNAETGQI